MPARYYSSCMMVAAVALLLSAGHVSAAGLELDRTMDEATARAMLGRFGYGATPASLAAAEKQTARQYLLHGIVDVSGLPPPVSAQIAGLPISEPADALWARLGPGGSARGAVGAAMPDVDARKALQQEEGRYAKAALRARLLTMANADNSGHEILLAFWLNHFSIYAPKGQLKVLAWDYARALEQAMRADSFEALLRASFYHPAMQIYLDNAQSTASNSTMAVRAAARGKQLGINENLARELLELHTLGVDGGYTQKDIQELARIITGAGVYAPNQRAPMRAQDGSERIGLFLFNPLRHDYDEKEFLGERFPAGGGIDEIDRALHRLALNPATARHIARKLAQRFLADEPPKALVDAMTVAYLRTQGQISATLLPLLESTAFQASLENPGKFKEPLDYALSVARAACGDTPVSNGAILAATVNDMGEAPMMRTTPDGYGSRESDWLSPAAMAKRTRFAIGVASGRIPLAAGTPADERIDDALPVAGGDAKMQAAGEPARPVARGVACSIDSASLERMVGPLSAATKNVLARLTPPEQAAVLLSSPEFMRR